MAVSGTSTMLPFGIAAKPLPGRNGNHLITTNFTTWDHVLRFVAEDPEIFAGLRNMYPRAMPQIQVKNLSAEILKRAKNTQDQACMVFTDSRTPAACVEFLSSTDRKDKAVPSSLISCRAFDVGPQRLWVVFFPMSQAPNTAMFWMNPGVGISTRQAEEALLHIEHIKEIPADSEPLQPETSAKKIQEKLQQRVVNIVNRAPLCRTLRPAASDVYLFPTGMAAIYGLHTYLLATYKLPSVLYGFPFHSTKHIFEDFVAPGGHLFLGNADTNDLETLKSYLADLHSRGQKIQALWTEFPTNPSCHTPDLFAIRQLADQYSLLLIADDTIAGTANVDLFPVVDIVITSLTKSFSGYADVMGGSVILSPASKSYTALQQIFKKHYRNELHHTDATVLLANSEDYISRSSIYNRNGAALASFFTTYITKPNSVLTKLYHPTTLPSGPLYTPFMRPATPDFTPGHGLLMTIEFTNMEALAAFHNAINLIKSPHLGAHVTLVLPYVKGLFDKELEQVAKWDMRQTQLRIAPGLEEAEGLVKQFQDALEAAEKAVTEKR